MGSAYVRSVELILVHASSSTSSMTVTGDHDHKHVDNIVLHSIGEGSDRLSVEQLSLALTLKAISNLCPNNARTLVGKGWVESYNQWHVDIMIPLILARHWLSVSSINGWT